MNQHPNPDCPRKLNLDLNRRDFVRWLSMGTTAAFSQPWMAMAGPFSREDFTRLVPEDKKLRPEWVKSLFERGQRAVYRGSDLEKIGMPIGGLCCGQVYLGGDGGLWHWDIFNRRIATGAEHYAKPMPVQSPFSQGFALRVRQAGQTRDRILNRTDWREVSFTGEYPIGYVEYRDDLCPVGVTLQAFSPFIPLNVEDSSLPATLLDFTVRNLSNAEVEVELAGWIENAICLHSGQSREGFRRNRLTYRPQFTFLECSAGSAPPESPTERPDIVFDNFEEATYRNWSVTGTAFGRGPVEQSQIPDYQGQVGGLGQRVVNSHASAPGSDVSTRDDAQGSMLSRSFVLERHYITFLIGGGAHAEKTCMNLIVNDQVVLSATGANDNRMKPISWDVRRWSGQKAQLQIVDNQSGGWGNIGIDDIVLSDRPRVPLGPLAGEPDFGTMGLALLNPQPEDFDAAELPNNGIPKGIFSPTSSTARKYVTRPFGKSLVGSIGRKLKLAAGQSAKATFVLTWHLPNLKMDRLPPGRAYAARFNGALDVAAYIASEIHRLSSQTRLWHDTWYDSTLPYWFLDRTFLNTSILATSTCYRFANGRFYAWEGVGCCEGTCGHVWQYAQAMARLFPELERITRAQVDFGLALQPDGAIHFRGEFNNIPAVDGQAGTILRALREHQMSANRLFLEQNWTGIKKALQWLIAKDINDDGLIEDNQHNTLDTDWYGPVAWLSGLYLAALLAGEQMATEMRDDEFAKHCRAIFNRGTLNIVARLFDDGYFINKPDPKRPETINSGTGCHIDQVMGQSWAFQVGLPRVLPIEETLSALRSLWRCNFTPDVGPYRKAYLPGRWYAMAGEAGLLMCTFPRTDWDYAQAKGKGPDWAAGYFNECMNGFEYQVAGHMIWEGLLLEGMAIARAVHDRYHPSRRNPWNEVECGDHYARSMASYGVFLAACGYEYHGPQGYLAFAPRLTPESYRAAFTTAEGWGSFSQTIEASRQMEIIKIVYGHLNLKTLAFQVAGSQTIGNSEIKLDGKPVAHQRIQKDQRMRLELSEPVLITAGHQLEIVLA
ncbi:MAG TPA: GH116 family glycosyl-hydrolase [Candidatus Paceibacterota bacterium]|nr:GH116 family glycosyl-hydrolase [Candidatus Paceibacterota bacterium]